jgi:uncharacterized membrane protein YbhN (UPF0104 family)
MKKASTARRFWLLTKALVTSLLLIALVAQVEWRVMADSLRAVRCGFLCLAVLGFLTIAALEVTRLRVAFASFALSWQKLWHLHVVGLFWGSFFPGQLGADLYKLAALRPVHGSVALPAVLVVSLRVLGLSVSVAAALIVMIHRETISHWLGQGALVGFGAGRFDRGFLVGFLFVVAMVVAACSINVVRSRIPALGERVRNTLRDLRGVFGGATLGMLLLLSCLILAARVAVFSFLTMAVGEHIALAEMVLVVTFATLATCVPISVAGLGLREGTVVYFLVLYGAVYENAVIVALLGRIFLLLFSLAGGLWLLLDLADRKRCGEKN